MGGRGGERVQEGASGAKLGRAGWPPTYATLGGGGRAPGCPWQSGRCPSPAGQVPLLHESPDSEVTGPRALGVIQS